jgi:hypothetical protein
MFRCQMHGRASDSPRPARLIRRPAQNVPVSVGTRVAPPREYNNVKITEAVGE